MKKTIRLTESKLRNIIKESIKSIIKESTLPNYDNPVFLGCESEADADFMIEVGYSDYSSSRFYVGGCYDEFDAFETVVKWMRENGILENYAEDEEMVQEYPDDYLEVDGAFFRNDNFIVKSL